MQRKTRKLFHLIITHFLISIQNIFHLSKADNWNNSICLENIKKHQESNVSMYMYLCCKHLYICIGMPIYSKNKHTHTHIYAHVFHIHLYIHAQVFHLHWYIHTLYIRVCVCSCTFTFMCVYIQEWCRNG